MGRGHVSFNGCAITPSKDDERRLIMKAKRTMKTLKAAVAAAGLVTVLVVPTGCASSTAGSGGLVGGASGGCVISALGVCV